jgi:hypothetical protein
MECSEVRKRLAAGEEAAVAELDAHLAECQECSLVALEQTGAALGEGALKADAGQLDALLARVGNRLADERGTAAWLRSRPTWQRWGFGALVAICGPLLFAAARPRADWAVYPIERLLTGAVLLVGLVTMCLWVKLRPLHRPRLSTRTPVLLAIASLTVMFVDVALPAAHSLHPASLVGTGADFLPQALSCLFAGLLMGVPALVLTAMLDRSNDGWRDASILGAVIAAQVGYLYLHLHCPIVAPVHLLAGHMTVLLVFLAAYPALCARTDVPTV